MRDIESLNRYRDLTESGVSPETAWKTVLCGSRDHARTPMQWTNEAYAGFSVREPWIRVGDKDVCNAADEMRDETSVWSAYQTLIALRKEHPALVYGRFEPYSAAKDDVFCYFREDGGERFYVEVNLTARSIRQPRS
jgi:oligo-1,6-glucosidase